MTTFTREQPRLALAAGGSGGGDDGDGRDLVMTPQLRRTIEFLQQSRLELIAEIRRAMADERVALDRESEG